MEILKKRSMAWLVAIVIIIAGTLFGVHRSVDRETAKIEAQFYDGVYIESENYTEPSIQQHLDRRLTAALGMITIAAKYEDSEISKLADALRQSRLELISAQSIASKYVANQKLEEAYRALQALLLKSDMTDSVKTALDSYARTLSGAQKTILGSRYNALAGDFGDELTSSFPVNVFRLLGIVNAPELFGSKV